MNKEQQAFPRHADRFNGQRNIVPYQEEGMTLRDYFAAKAVQGLLADPITLEIMGIASAAYEIADEMMRAREKQNAIN